MAATRYRGSVGEWGVWMRRGSVIEQSYLRMKRVRCLRAALLALVVLVLSGGAIPAVAAAPEPGRIGGPPSRPLDPPDEGARTTAARVIGVGHAYDGWLGIDAYGWRPPSNTPGVRHQLCTWVELEVLQAPMYSSCFASGQIRQPIAIASNLSVTSPKSLRDTEVGGPLASDVARVELSVKRPGHRKKTEGVQATVAQVSGRLQKELRQPRPFGYFYAKVHGVVPAKDIIATAYDAGGQVLGTTHRLR